MSDVLNGHQLLYEFLASRWRLPQSFIEIRFLNVWDSPVFVCRRESRRTPQIASVPSTSVIGRLTLSMGDFDWWSTKKLDILATMLNEHEDPPLTSDADFWAIVAASCGLDTDEDTLEEREQPP